MSKIFKLIWEHKKKCIFFTASGYYGFNYLHDRHKNFLMLRALCQESLEVGRMPKSHAGNRHITMILNPVASNRKGKGKYEKYAEPLLHLSGFLINVVKTERISEARDLTELIERTNAIAVIGGDGTLFEVVTGLLRRDDANEAVRRYPIAVIPVGMQNRFAKRLMSKENVPEHELIAESAMAIVRHRIKPHDVIEIEVVEQSAPSTPDNEALEPNVEVPEKPLKPVYSVSGVNFGQFREADAIQAGMSTIFPDKFAAFWSLLRAPRIPFKAELRYTPPCTGCTKCITEESASGQSSLLSRVSSFLRPTRVASEVKIKTENPECGIWHSMCVDTLEFNVKSKGKGCLEVDVGVNTGRTEFIREGLRRYDGQEPTLSNRFDCSQLEITPISSPEFCSIDYEEFEVKPLKIKVLRDKVYFYTPQ